MRITSIRRLVIAGLALGIGAPLGSGWLHAGNNNGAAIADTAEGQPPSGGRGNRQQPPPRDDQGVPGDDDRQPPPPPPPPDGPRSGGRDAQRGEGEIRTRRAGRGWPLIPPPIERQLHLTSEQRKQVADLEKEVHDKLMNILTDDQKNTLKTMRRPGPGGRGPGGDDGAGRGGPPQGGRPPRDDDGGPPSDNRRQRNDDRPPPRDDDRRPPDGPPPEMASILADNGLTASAGNEQGIQWYPTWQSGLRAARLSGRPILLVSAAPHCAGIPGTW